jgi:hypothetical protein
MAQQSTTEPRKAPDTVGAKTREQQKAVIEKRENTKGSDAPSPDETLKHAQKRYPAPGPAAYDMKTGHREIQRGANDESEHRKRRTK